MRHHVFRGDPVDVVAAHFLKFQHHLGETGRPDFLAGLLLADVIVLAENTTQVAPGKKDGPAALPSAQTIFLAKMRKVTCHACIAACAADHCFICEPIDLAVPGTDTAIFQAVEGFIHTAWARLSRGPSRPVSSR